jgi:uncharacterized protein (DUF1684 family)
MPTLRKRIDDSANTLRHEMTQLENFRQQIDQFFATSGDSPLEPTQQREFMGLSYYAESADFIFDVTLEPTADNAPYIAQTSTGDEVRYERLGQFSFAVDGEDVTLVVLGSGEGDLFVPFRDATSGKETYGAGRYLDDHRYGITHLGGDDYRLDFNYCYNPFCAFSPYFSCPLPPRENWLPVAIEAGEKRFESDEK